MRQSPTKLLVILLLPMLQSCDSPPEVALHGNLYFASGNYIGQFDLEQGSSSIVANRGAVTIRDVSYFGENRLLIAEVTTVKDVEVPRISWVDLKTGEAATLYTGVAARYLPAHRALVFDDGTRLHVMSRTRNSDINAEIISHNLNQLSTIIDVSDDALLFEIGMPDQRSIYSYDVSTRKLRQRNALTATCRLNGAVWIDDREQLACPARASVGDGPVYLLVDVEGNVRGELALPEGKHFLALAYAPDQGTLFFAEQWRGFIIGGERFAVWAYRLVDGKSYRLVSDQYLGASAVYSGS